MTNRSGLAPQKKQRKISKLNVAKVLCDFYSDLTFSEQCEITIDSEPYQTYVNDVLETNGFWDNVPELISSAYALGGGCIKVYADNSEPKLNYIHADRFVPCEWDGKNITGGIFQSTSMHKDYYYTLCELYTKGNVENKLFKSKTIDNIGVSCLLSELYTDVAESVTYNDVNVPMFAYFKPCVSNNAEYETPLGMSIYANAIDTLEALDVTFDSFAREVVLGKKRIIVPSTAVQTVVEPLTGEVKRYFDADDEVFTALSVEDKENLQIVDNSATLRISEHAQAINALLNILCFQVGLSAGSLSFDAVQGMKTATEIISQDSKTARTIKGNKNLLTETFEDVVHAIIALGVALGQISKTEYTVTIGFKDNIIIDDNTLIDNNIKLVQAGLKSKISAIMEVLKCDEETAQKELDRITQEQSVTGLAVDDLMSGGEIAGNVDETVETLDSETKTEVIDDAEDMAGKTLNGAQTQSLISIIAQYQSGALSIGQAVNIVSVSIGVSKDEAKKIIEGQNNDKI